MMYGCGHESTMIVTDNSAIVFTNWLIWKNSTGFDGTNEECFKCYCKRIRKQVIEGKRLYKKENLTQRKMERKKMVCANCGKTGNEAKITVHHVKWLSMGGQDTEDNKISLCLACHRKIHNKEV